MTSKKILPFLPYAAIVLAIVGYFAFFGQSKTSLPDGANRDSGSFSSSSTENGTGSSAEEIQASNLAKYTASTDAMDADACSEISGDDDLRKKCVDNVYAALAAKNKDSDYCGKISNPSVKVKCSDSFAYDEAVEKGDSAICRKLSEPELAKACVRTVTFAKIESGTGSAVGVDECAKLDSEADREYCRNRIANAASVDLAKEALLKKDRSVCLKITDKVLSSSCSDAVILETVAANGEFSSCAMVVDAAKKAKCESVARTIGDSAKFKTAIDTGDFSACASILAEDLRTRCSDVLFLKAAIAAKDSGKCSSIVNSTVEAQCLSATSVK